MGMNIFVFFLGRSSFFSEICTIITKNCLRFIMDKTDINNLFPRKEKSEEFFNSRTILAERINEQLIEQNLVLWKRENILWWKNSRRIMAEKYTVSTLSVETVLGYIKSGEIAIPGWTPVEPISLRCRIMT